jgi:hypothetical protein
MRLIRILPLMVIIATSLAGVATAAALLSPGTPCSDIGQPAPGPCVAGSNGSSTSPSAFADVLFNLVNDPGTQNLGIFVVPGDVVLFEHTGGSLMAPTTWSDVVRFTTGPNSSSATILADGENGVILPPGFTLSANATSIVEVQTGTGTDADFTVYTAGSATYNVHSDAALTPEPPEPMEGTPEPSTLTLLIGGSLFLVGRTLRRQL